MIASSHIKGSAGNCGRSLTRVRVCWGVSLIASIGLLAAQTPASAQAPVQAVPAAAESQTTSTAQLKVSYSEGQLKIEATDSTLEDILTRVASSLGVKIDIPEAIKREKAFVTFGPGSPREVLAAFLADTGVDYVIQEGETSSARIRSVLLLERQKNPAGAAPTRMAVNTPRNPSGRAAATASAEPPASTDPAASAQPEITIANVDPNSQLAAAQPPVSTGADSSASPGQSLQAPTVQPAGPALAASQPGMLNGLRVAPVSPPSTLDSVSINQQLQQMYQQRALITQQGTPAPVIK